MVVPGKTPVLHIFPQHSGAIGPQDGGVKSGEVPEWLQPGKQEPCIRKETDVMIRSRDKPTQLNSVKYLISGDHYGQAGAIMAAES